MIRKHRVCALPLLLLCVILFANNQAHAEWIEDGVPICDYIMHQLGQQVATDGSGGAFIAWQDQRSGVYDIYAQRVSAYGVMAWANDGIIICMATGIQTEARIAYDGQGGALIAWVDKRTGVADIYVQRVSGTGTALWTVDGTPVCLATGNQLYARIVSDGEGGAILCWQDERNGNKDIFAQRVDASGSVLWTANGVPISEVVESDGFPNMVADGSGGVIITWNRTRSGGNDICAQRVNASGVVQWTTNGVVVCGAANGRYYPEIASLGADGAVITWFDSRDGSAYDIYAQRVDLSGLKLWTADGVAVCDTVNAQDYPMIASVGFGNVVIVWRDDRSGINRRLFAQKLDSGGGTQWERNGLLVCADGVDQTSHVLTADAAGGAIITCMDTRNSGWDIYAQRLSGDGVQLWGAGGIPVCDMGQSQGQPKIAPDGEGGANIVWYDYRNGNYDVFGLRLDSTGDMPLLYCDKEGDPAFYYAYNSAMHDVPHGEYFSGEVGLANFGFVSISCPDTDTFCVHIEDSRGWVITGNPPLGDCYLLDSGYIVYQNFTVTVPCEAAVGTVDTVFITAAFCDANLDCIVGCGDCENPNWYDDSPYYYLDTLILHVIEEPPAVAIEQDTLTLIDQGNHRAGVLFSICNRALCSGPQDFEYRITSQGVIGSTLDTTGTVTEVLPAVCADIAAVLDASSSSVGDTDTLTIVAWTVAVPVAYDTCVQIVQVAEVQFVPLMGTPLLVLFAAVSLFIAALVMRRRAALCTLIALLALAAAMPASSRENKSERVRPTQDRSAVNARFDLEPWVRSNYMQAAVDTFTIIRFDFEGFNWQGWTRIDNSAQVDTFFHADDFDGLSEGSYGLLVPLEGTKSMWCGVRPDAMDPYVCSWVAAPGYGSGWVQYLISEPGWFEAPLSLSYLMSIDTEPYYDVVHIEYDEGGYNWQPLAEYDGVKVVDTTHTLGLAAAPTIYTGTDDLSAEKLRASYNIRTKFRIRFTSDGAWSDQDGLWNTDGACIIDSITVSDGTGLVDYEDFESWSVGAKQKTGSFWRAEPRQGYDMYSGLQNNLQEKDPCGFNFGTQIVFFVGSDEPSADYPGLWDTPFCSGAGGVEYPCQDEMVISPVIDMTKYSMGRDENQDADISSEDLSQLGGAILRFTVYRDLPLPNLVFYNWQVRSIDPVTQCPSRWRDRSFVYYGYEREYIYSAYEIGDLVSSDPIQVSIGCIDMCGIWYGVFGNCDEHTPSPWFDNVEVVRYKKAGPQWYSRSLDLFQDNFPEYEFDIESYVRADMANDINVHDDLDIRPGDSIIVNCASPLAGGLRMGGVTGDEEIYCHVRAVDIGPSGRPPLQGSSLVGTYGAYVSDGGGWTIIQCPESRTSTGNPVVDRYMVDLNDSLFTRGYMIEYYFEAYDLNNDRTTLPEQADDGQYFEFTCLPTLASNILYVDDYDGIGTREGIVQNYFDYTFRLLFGNDGAKPDRYDVNSPQSLVGNGPGSRAKFYQLSLAYDAIIWDSGDLGDGTIATGGPLDNCKSPDTQMLLDWLELSDHDVGLWVLGDNVAEDLDGSPAPSAHTLLTNCGVTLYHGSYFNMTGGIGGGGQVSPLAEEYPGGFLSSMPGFYVNGGCPELNDFDVLETTGNGLPTLAYIYESDTTYAGIQSEWINYEGHTARSMWCGFSFMYMRDVSNADPPVAQTELARQVLTWFLGGLEPPVYDETVPAYRYSLEQNFPNPFNPTTTLRFSLKEKGHASFKVYDVAGRLVAILVDEVMDAGPHEVQWNGKNHLGLSVASGIYFVRMEAGGFKDVRKLVLLR